ncbi:MAG: FHA domain-containing protein [Bacteriovoracaceae bacterium]
MRLEILDEKNNKFVKTFAKEKILIGRSKDADLKIDGEGISRKHLYLEQKNGKYFVTDLGSANGVYINEERMESNSHKEVLSFFPIRIGVITTISILADEEEEEPVYATAANANRDPLKDIESNTVTKSIRNYTPKAKPPVKEKPKKKTDPVVLFVLFVILGGVLYYVYKNFIAEEEVTTVAEGTTQAPEAQAATKATNLYQGLNSYKKEDLTLYQSLHKKAICQTMAEKSLCTKLDLKTDDGEGVFMENKNVYIYANFSKMLNGKYKDQLKGIKTEKEFVLYFHLAIESYRQPDLNESNAKILFLININDGKDGVSYIMDAFSINRESYLQIPSNASANLLKAANDAINIEEFMQPLRPLYLYSIYATAAELP